MKQLVNDLRSGDVIVEEVGAPAVRSRHVLIGTRRSLISSGTERSLIEFGKANYVQKARQQPERVKKVLDKARTDGMLATVAAVQDQLDRAVPLGYCNVGTVLAVGEGVTDFSVGDRVASNGGHAEVVCVPKHLCAKVPDGVTDDQATFTVIGAIALQGVRLLEPTLGESFAVFGLGLVGLVAVQLLLANGVRVIGFDTNVARVDLARAFGAEALDLASEADPVAAAHAFCGEAGVDGVLVTASTKSNDLMHKAAQMSRQRGRIVLTGVVGLQLQRADFYEKELSFRVSCSYGPGRYDPSYEERGADYPLGFVRWTEQRNFTAVLELLRCGRLRVEELISARYELRRATEAYDAVAGNGVIGVLLEYPAEKGGPGRDVTARTVQHSAGSRAPIGPVGGVIGVGSFAQATLLPALTKAGAELKWATSSGGMRGALAARRYPIAYSTTDVDKVIDDPDVTFVVVSTRHDSHASLTIRALEAGKSVFVEKPLCLTRDELTAVTEVHRGLLDRGPHRPILMVGFNRRFSPLVGVIGERLRGRRRPLTMTFTANVGDIEPSHWVHDPAVGGGRLVGEACHFIDLLRHLAGVPISRVFATASPVNNAPAPDTASITLDFADGSVGVVNYFANGSRRYPKEILEVFCEGRVLRMENFRRLRWFGYAGIRSSETLRRQDKGHNAEMLAFVDSVRDGKESPIPFDQIAEVTEASFAMMDVIRDGLPRQLT
jgi:predicted dehydrogenase/threonine dehydrogenase-like Zn-dependent dehydrogenase